MIILRYEMKRIWLGRLYPVLLICNAVYACIWMRQSGIAGVGGTAPFSKWTYLAYCGAMLPAAILTFLLLLANYYSPKHRKADILPFASPFTERRLMLIRLMALLCGFLILFALEFAVFAAPNILFYQKYTVLLYFAAGLIHMLPALVLSLGFGCILGKCSSKLIYVIAILILSASLIQPAVPYDLFGNAFFMHYPFTLPLNADGEPAYRIVPLWIAARFLYLAAGILLILLGVCRTRKPQHDRAEAAA